MPWLALIQDHLWQFWRPDVLVLQIVLACIYIMLIRQIASGQLSVKQEQPTPSTTVKIRAPWRRHLAFSSGLVVMYVAMGPLAFLGEQESFTLYVIQMLTSTMVLPWLLIFSLPYEIIQLLLQIRWIKQILYWWTRPIFAMVLFNGLLTATLIPVVLNHLLADNWLHVIAQNVIFLAAVFFWWPIVSPLPEFPQMGRGLKILYIAYSTNFMMPIIVILLISHNPWYPLLAQGVEQLGFSPLADQQVGGIVMLVAMYLIYGTLGIRLYSRQDESIWYQ
ncbi:MAG: cytochrome c oxidase assembly protein [Firmicutes bacterium]|nr:cytochrome c oxidase assembly protein [Bacillota bacterium]